MEFIPRKYSEMCIDWAQKHGNKPPDEFVRYQLDYNVDDEEIIRQALEQKKEFWLSNSDSPNPLLRKLWRLFLKQHDQVEQYLLDRSKRHLLAIERASVPEEHLEQVGHVDTEFPDNSKDIINGECSTSDRGRTPIYLPLAFASLDFNVESIPINPFGGVYRIELSCLKPTEGELKFFRLEEIQPGFTGDSLTVQEINQKRTLIPHTEKPTPGGTKLIAIDYNPNWGINYYVPVVSRGVNQVPGVVKRGFRIGAVENLQQLDTLEEGHVQITWDWPKNANQCCIICEMGNKAKPERRFINEHDFINQERRFTLQVALSVLYKQKVGVHVAGILEYMINSESKKFVPELKEFIAYKILPVTKVIFELYKEEGWADNSEYKSIQIRVKADPPEARVPELAIYACQPPNPAVKASREIKTRVGIIPGFTGYQTFKIEDKSFLKPRFYFRVEAADENDALSLEIVLKVIPDSSSLPFRSKVPNICYYCFKKVYKSNMLVRCAHPDCIGEEDEVLNEWWDYWKPGIIKGKQGKYLTNPDGLIKKLFPSAFRNNGCDHNFPEYCCPKCHNTLPAMENRSNELIISIVGGKGSGKTVYLGVLLNAFMETITKKYHYNLEPLNDEVRERYNQIYADPIKNMSLPDHTIIIDPEVRHPLVFQLSKGKSETKKILVFYDASGEQYYDMKKNARYNQYIKYSHAIFFMIDSEESAVVRDRMKITRSARPYDHRDILRRAHTLITENLSKINRIKVPIALIATKADGLSDITLMNNNPLILEDNPLRRESKHGPSYDWSKGEIEHQYAMKLIECMFPGITSSANEKFEFVRCFALSALGQHPENEKLKEPAKPNRVLDPLIWLLDLYGWNDKK